MGINNYHTFNEKMGISPEMEKQVDDYMLEIKKRPSDKVFQLTYNNNLGSFKFTLKIDEKLGNPGNVRIVSRTKHIYIITIKDANDVGTLLHEVKHMDYSIRNKDGELKNTYNQSRATLTAHPNQTDKIKILTWIFYIYNDDEFQSQFQSMYKSFDIKFAEIAKNMKREEITYNFIYEQFKLYIDDGDHKMITMFYFMKRKFTFDIFCPEKLTNRLFLYLISSKEIDKTLNDNPYKGLYKAVKYSLERLIRSAFNKYSDEQMIEISRVKKFFETDIARKNKVYSRKILRIVTLIYDKYQD